MGYRNVVVGTDGSATAEKAVAEAAQIAKTFGARLTIVTAYVHDKMKEARKAEPLPYEMQWMAKDVNEAEARAKRGKALAKKILGDIDRKTLGQLIQALKKTSQPDEQLEELLMSALTERNRLNHSFYRQHNLRRNSEEGRMLMLADLQVIHERLLDAYTAVLPLARIEISEDALLKAQSGHLPL